MPERLGMAAGQLAVERANRGLPVIRGPQHYGDQVQPRAPPEAGKAAHRLAASRPSPGQDVRKVFHA